MENTEFDLAAMEAEKVFPVDGSAKDVIVWWGEWYMKAGHKRLGRILAKQAKAPKGWDKVETSV